MSRGSEGDTRVVSLWLSRRAVALVDAAAAAERVGRSEMLRRLLASGMKARGLAGSAMPAKGVQPRFAPGGAFDEVGVVPASSIEDEDEGGVPW